MRYRENGDLERMQRFWFTGACEPRKRRRTSSKPLALAQFMSAFLLLGIGILFSGVLLLCETAYFGFIRRYMSGVENPPWCALISLSIAESLFSNNKGVKKSQIEKQLREKSVKNEKYDDNIKNNEQYNTSSGRRKEGTLSKWFDKPKTNHTISPSHHNHNNGNGSKCPDPLCEMSISTVTRQLDFCNKQIEMLQEALMTKEKSRTTPGFLFNHNKESNCGGIRSANISFSRQQSEDDRNIKDEDEPKAILTKNGREQISSSPAIKDREQSRMGQSVIATQRLKDHLRGVSSVSEIETVL